MSLSEIWRKSKSFGGILNPPIYRSIQRIKGSFTPKADNYEIRIPSNKFEQFNNEVGELGNPN